VQSLPIVDLLDEGADPCSCVNGIAIGTAIDLLLLQGLHEAFRLGIVVGIADTTHARPDIVVGKQPGIVAAGVLHAAVGVVDEAAGRRVAFRDRHGECGDSEARLQMRLQRPADDAAAEGVEDDGEIGELFGKMQVG